MKDTKWKKIGPFPGIVYAEMVAEVLRQQNIPFYVTQDGVSATYGVHGTSIVGNKAFLFVPEEFYEAVLEIVEGMADLT